MTAKQSDGWRKWMTAGLMALCMISCVVLFKAYLDGKFDSIETLQQYIAGFGLLAPFILVMIQAAQVILPVLPGFLGCAVGAILFGWAGGFWCNYIGISVGSLVAFLIARKYGKDFVSRMFPGNKYEKWAAWAAESKSYTAVLLLGMILPLFPDDFFCYFTGITKMSVRKFATIIVLGKPWCILAYSIMFATAA
ncbi:MAG: TVP38/TMEM64 family protein [Hespellia sp.]|nr:TVP38/TMEM64 family protein [Hespellia sp.]